VDSDALEERVLPLRVYRALLVHDLLVFRVVVPRLLATRVALDSRNFMVWLALSGVPRVVPLAFVEVVVAIALLIVVALGEAGIFIILLVGQPCHHVTQLHSSSQVAALKSWYMFFVKRPCWKQRMASSSVMLARFSKKHHV
jgi:hypothetical protein